MHQVPKDLVSLHLKSRSILRYVKMVPIRTLYRDCEI